MHLSDTCICFTKYTSIVRFVFQNHDVMCQNITRKCIMLTTSTHGYTLVYIYIYTLTLLKGKLHLSDKRYLHLSDSSSMHLSDLSMHLSDTCICPTHAFVRQDYAFVRQEYAFVLLHYFFHLYNNLRIFTTKSVSINSQFANDFNLCLYNRSMYYNIKLLII